MIIEGPITLLNIRIVRDLSLLQENYLQIWILYKYEEIGSVGSKYLNRFFMTKIFGEGVQAPISTGRSSAPRFKTKTNASYLRPIFNIHHAMKL